MEEKYRIINSPYRYFHVEALCKFRQERLFRKPRIVEEWRSLSADGIPVGGVFLGKLEPVYFETISEAKVFIKWLTSDKIFRD